MSKFMDFLENIDNDIINETYVERDIVEEVKPKPTKKIIVDKVKSNTSKKDSSVKLIESRIRTKLYNIGLNENAISDVVSFVFNGVSTVSDIKPSNIPTQKPNSPVQKTPAPQVKPKNMAEMVRTHAESLLEGLPETPTLDPTLFKHSGESIVESNVSDVASHASSLL